MLVVNSAIGCFKFAVGWVSSNKQWPKRERKRKTERKEGRRKGMKGRRASKKVESRCP